MTPSKEMEWVYSFNLDSTSGLRPRAYLEHLAVVYLVHGLPYVTSNIEKLDYTIRYHISEESRTIMSQRATEQR